MFCSRVLNLHRNISSQNRVILSVNRISVSNLNEQRFKSVINDSFENYELLENEIPATSFLIPIDHSLLNIPNNNDHDNNFNNELGLKRSMKQHFSHSENGKLTTPSYFHKTSTFLSPKYSFINKSCITAIGLRHFSSETTQHVPVRELTGFWKDISESAPVEFFQDNLIAFQSSTNLPWWATIIITTFIVRGTMTLPLTLYQHYIFAKVQNLHIAMKPFVKKSKMEANIAVSHYGCSEDYARMIYNQSLHKKWTELIQKENCHPAKGWIVLWTQIPVWIILSSAIRNLCLMLPLSRTNAEQIYLELTTGGFGWVVNLIDVDHYWILPVSLGLFNLANIEIMSLSKTTEDSKVQKYLRHFHRFISIAIIPLSTYVPSCICLYWASSSAFGLLQNIVLLSPKIRRLCGVPLTANERTTPYRDILAKFRAKEYINFGHKSTTTLE